MIARIAHIKWKEAPTAVLFETVTVLLDFMEHWIRFLKSLLFWLA